MASSDNKILLTVLVLVFVIILIGIFYWLSSDKDDINKKEKTVHNVKKEKVELISILSNTIENGEIDSRIVNPITKNGIIYIYCNKESKYTSGVVSLLSIIEDNKTTKQIVFSGFLTYEFDYDEYSIYKFNVKNKKKSVTTKLDDNLITQRLLNKERMNTRVFDLSLVKDIKNLIKNNNMINIEIIDDDKINHIDKKINLLSRKKSTQPVDR